MSILHFSIPMAEGNVRYLGQLAHSYKQSGFGPTQVTRLLHKPWVDGNDHGWGQEEIFTLPECMNEESWVKESK